MDDARTPEGDPDEPTDRASDEARGGPLAWPSPPPRTIEHAVALLAATWTSGPGGSMSA